jgi:hypothetical protein
VLARRAVAVHVIHFTGKALGQPFLKVRETVGLDGRRDPDQRETEFAGALFETLFEHSGRSGKRNKFRSAGNALVDDGRPAG